MSNHWDSNQVLALAPDAASIKAANKLKSTSKWPLLAHDACAVWGQCKGSGSTPYQTRIDLEGPAFKCSCPSRKFPCKHALALFQLYVETPKDFQQSPPPAWVTSWLQARERKASGKQQSKPADPKARAQRQQQREQRITAGVTELSLWLRDSIRDGIGTLATHPHDYWQSLAARMVDAQAPGLANRIRELGDLTGGEDWESRVLLALGRLHLLLEAFKRRDTLDEPTRGEIRSQLGLTQSKDEVAASAGVEDIWRVLGHSVESNDELIARRVYLHGENSRRFAMMLSFAHAAQAHTLAVGWTAPRRFRGKLHFFQGLTELRCQPGQVEEIAPFERLRDTTTASDDLDTWRAAAAANPWLSQHPVLVGNVHLIKADHGLALVDYERAMIALPRRFADGPRLQAIAGTSPVTVFGEYDGHRLNPLGIDAGGQYWPLSA